MAQATQLPEPPDLTEAVFAGLAVATIDNLIGGSFGALTHGHIHGKS